MLRKDVTITNNIGLHARPATFFIQKANAYKSSIWVEKDERKVNAKSCDIFLFNFYVVPHCVRLYKMNDLSFRSGLGNYR